MTQRLSYLASFATALVALFWAPCPAYSQGTPVIPRPYTIRTLALPESHTLVNSNGQVAVYYGSGQSTPGAFFWDSASGNLTSLEAAGLVSPRPTSINDAGQVVGVSLDMIDKAQVFLWQSGAAEALSLRGPAFDEGYYHINDAGLIAGTFNDGRKSPGFIWDHYHVSEFDIDGAGSPSITGFTNSGKIIGGSGVLLGAYQPFVWEGGFVQTIDIPAAATFDAIRMNEDGQVAGSYSTALDSNSRGFFWQVGVLSDLDVGSVATNVAMINSLGHVVGTAREVTGSQAFAWVDGTIATLLETAAGEESSAVWINDNDLIVGQKGPLGQGMAVPCLWQDGHSVSLKDTLPAYLHWNLVSVKQVANSGDILAVASRDGTTYLAVLHPLVDSDGDGLPNDWETAYGLNAQSATDADIDSDADGLTNRQEYHAATSPVNADTDGDGLHDGWEVAHGFDPRGEDANGDADNDGLTNLLEFQIGTNPNEADSDHDGLSDGQEVQLGTSPLNPDTDLDGMPDGWEEMYDGLNLFVNDGMLDADNDGFSNLQEYRLGTNPLVADEDSDGDGQPDLVDPWPTEYYNASLPTVVVTSGANQAGTTGAVLLQPIVVRVTNSYGQLLTNAPLLVTSSPAGATFGLALASHFTPTLNVRTGAEGTVTVYVKTPPTAMAFSVNFAVTSGMTFTVASAAAQSANAPSIAAGDYHTVVVGSSGRVWAWGLNSSGQLGDGTYLQRSLPSPVSGLSSVKSVVAGGYFTVALKQDGTVWAWGANRLGQLGDGTYVNSPIPVRVGTIDHIVAIAAGDNHSLALHADGTVYAWGFNSDGQLGDGTTSARNQPVVVSGTGSGSGILAITAGAYHSLALVTGGGVKGWGANFFGALGNNVGMHALSPVVLPLTNIAGLSAGAYHTMAVTIMGDGEALGWNENGQLGDSTTTSRSTAAPVNNLSNVKSMAASKSVAGHCLALSQGGSIWTWGGNDYGQAGTQGTGDQLTPQDIPMPAELTQVVAGGSHTIALGADGTIYMWGNNQFGELGDGTTVSRLEPVRKVGLCLLPTALDTDQDALPDSWEMQHFGNLSQNSDTDPDEDGLKTLLEYETARNPNVKDFEPSAVTPLTSQLVQMSSLGNAGVGDDAIIAGFIVTGDAPKTVILRALGPSVPLPGTLQDPQIELRDSAGPVAENNDWQDDSQQADLLENKYQLAPSDRHEAALIVTIPPGSYTAIVSGADHGTGIALFEIYDVDQSDSTIANLSARARLSSGSNVVIAGFTIAGSQPLRALIRGIGPSLQDFGIPDFLPNPYLHLHDAAGVQIDQNDNWHDSPNWHEMQDLGLQPSHNLEAALIRDLPTGPSQLAVYTAVVEASANTPVGGISLVEVFSVDTGLDSDGDGLTDWEETNVYHTNPNSRDTDGDGMEDGWEVHHGLNANNPNDAGTDLDGDGMSNLYEYQHNTDPAHFDLPTGTTVGATQGKLSIDNSGGASYSIPVVVAPGTAGMQPKLSIDYSNRAGNGLLGVGWSIGGLSAITRSSTTIAQDNFIAGVNFNANDRFSVDGQRLIAVNGADGAAGTEYRTEIDSFSRIVSVGQSGSGPRSFTVQTKSGLTYTYGETDDSRFLAQGRTDNSVLTWALSKISDTSGNYMLFRYERVQEEGQYWPVEIKYTLNDGAGLTAYASVQFTYDEQPRPDVSVGYVAGSKVTQAKRLKNVRTLSGAQLVRQYDLSYIVSPQTKRSRLNQIQEGAGQACGGNGPCATFNPTTFTWSTEGETDSFALSPFRPQSPGNKRTQQWVPGDFTGDGRSDIAKITGNQNGGQYGQAIIAVSVAQPSAPGAATDFQTSTWITGGTFNYNTDAWQGGDYNGDGKADIIRVYRDTEGSNDAPIKVGIYRNGGANNFLAAPCSISNNFSIPSDHLVYPADVDGDGRLDLVLIYGHTGTMISVLKNIGNNGDVPQFQHQTWYQNAQNTVLFGLRLESFLGDVNNDGLPDIIFVKNTGTGNNLCEAWVFLNQQSTQYGFSRSFAAQRWMSPAGSGEPNVEQAIWFGGDFNGDGLFDLGRLRKGSAEVVVYPSTGRSFSKEPWGNISIVLPNNPDLEEAEVRGGDFNGDGRSDIGLVTSAQVGSHCWDTKQRTYLSLGSRTAGFATGSTTVIEGCAASDEAITTFGWLPADFNGDGKEDFARAYGYVSSGQTGVGVHVWTGTSGVHDLLQSATDGLGSRSSVSYKPLTDPTVYPTSPAPYALAGAIDLMLPMSVVSQVRHDDGLGGEYAVDYQYHGLKASPLRGILGFRSVTSTDTRTQIWSKATLSQVFPFTGMAEQMESYPPGSSIPLTFVTTTYADRPTYNGRIHLPYAQSNTADSRDIDPDRTLISHITTVVNDMDDYGNTKNVVVTSNDGFTKTTVSNYDIDLANWRIGKLHDSTVTSQAPGQPNVVRKSGFTYAGNGQIGSETIEPNTPLASQTDYQYDAFGNARIVTTPGDSQSRTTTSYFDPRGRYATSVINALGHSETREYDERWGAATKVTGPNGLSTRTIYDDFGRKRLETTADGSRTIITYDKVAEGDPYKPQRAAYRINTIPDGASFSAAYFDQLGRELRKVTKSGVDDNGQSKIIAVDTTYDALGRAEYVTRPYFFSIETPLTIRTHYDLLNRVKQVDTPKEGGGAAVTTNDYFGLRVESKNPLQQGTSLKTITWKDTQGHVVKIQDAKDGTITFTYDPVGNLIRTEDVAHNLTLMIYDVRGRRKLIDDPDLGVWNYDYNLAGELTYQRDAKGNIATMEYDRLGRIKKRTEVEGVSEWFYDEAEGKGIGKLHQAKTTPSDPNVPPFVRTMKYDNLGRLTHQTEHIDTVDYTMATGYDSLSRVSTLTYPTGFAVKQTYDANGYVQKIERSDTTGPVYWKANQYDANGHVTRQTAGNGVVTDRVYVTQTGMLKEIHSGPNSAVQNLSYQFDTIGNLTNRTDHLQWVQGGGQQTPGQVLKEDFVYDELNRLKFATVQGQTTKEVQYDLLGNITFRTGLGSYSYVPEGEIPTVPSPEAPHPHAVRKVGDGPEAEYDRNGNMTSGFDRTLTWTSFNMPKLVTRTSTGASSLFTYDSEHSRIKQLSQKAGAVTTTTYVSGGMFEIVDDVAKIARKHYISSPAGRIALYTEEIPHEVPSVPGPGPTTYKTQYLHKDHLDSIDTITNEAGAVIERDSFDAWGARRLTDWQPPGATPITSILNRGFTGHEQLDDLGLVHMNGRIYDPGIGRFMSADPFIQAPTETQNYNRYSYVLNNPTSLTDPSGFNFLGNFGKWLTKTFGPLGGQIVMGVIAIVAGIATAGVFTAAATAIWGSAAIVTSTGALTFAGSVVAGAGFGFGSAFASTILSGASIGEALQSAVIGAVIGGISGGIAKGLGDLNQAGKFFTWGHAGQTLGHALLGGAVSEVQGGSFESGALAGAINAAFGPAIDTIGGGSTDFEYVVERVAVAAVLGGTAAELGGGKFANGAVTAAFLRLYNEENAIKERERRIQEVRERIVKLAYEFTDSHGWLKAYMAGEFPAGRDKCNKFVYDVIILAGGEVQLIPKAWSKGGRIPRAMEWANRDLDMPGWRIVTNPQPGDIAAIGRANGSGHVGIVGYGNQTISASSMANPAGVIVLTPWGFRGNEGVRVNFRRYVGP